MIEPKRIESAIKDTKQPAQPREIRSMGTRSNLLVLAILLGLAIAAKADGINNRFNDGITNPRSAGVVPPAGNQLLLEAGYPNFLLLEDGISRLCLESGC